MVELFMRRRAALSASLLDLPPVREGLQYFWSGLDLKNITDEKYWTDRVGGGTLGLYQAPSDPSFSYWYTIENNTLLWSNSRRYSQGITPSNWISGTSYTVELMLNLDWSKTTGGMIVGHTGAGTSTLAFNGNPANGISVALGGSSTYLATGSLVEGTHYYALTMEPSGSNYLFTAYLDGVQLGERTEYRARNSAPSIYPAVALGALSSYARALTPEEIARNYRYYKSIWR